MAKPDGYLLDPRSFAIYRRMEADYLSGRLTNRPGLPSGPRVVPSGGSRRYGVLATALEAPRCALSEPTEAEFWPLVPGEEAGTLKRASCETEILVNHDPSLEGTKFWLVIVDRIDGVNVPLWVGCANAFARCDGDELCCDGEEPWCQSSEDDDDDTTEDSDDETTEDDDDSTTEDDDDGTAGSTTEDFDDDTTEDEDDDTTEDSDDATTEDSDDTGTGDTSGTGVTSESTGTGTTDASTDDSTFTNDTTEDGDDATTEDAGETTATPDTTEDRDDQTTEDGDDDDTTEDSDDTTGEPDGPEDQDDPDPPGGQFPLEDHDFGMCCSGTAGPRTISGNVAVSTAACGPPETLPNPPKCEGVDGDYPFELDFTRTPLLCSSGGLPINDGGEGPVVGVHQGYWRGPNPIADVLGPGNQWQNTDLIVYCFMNGGGGADPANWAIQVVDRDTDCPAGVQWSAGDPGIVACDSSGGPTFVGGNLAGGPLTDGCGNGCIDFRLTLG